jgi:hypothetical protein
VAPSDVKHGPITDTTESSPSRSGENETSRILLEDKMKKPGAMFLVLAVAIVWPVAMLAETDEGMAKERQLIEQAARDYIDGWYEGNEERMARALHPDLAKRRISTLPNGRGILETLSADRMVEYTRLGGGTKSHKEGQVNEVIILDILTETASVKTISPEFIDYIHLARINGQWRIVNVLWEPVQP